MGTTSQSKNGILKLSIVLIISGTIFDSITSIASIPFNDTYLNIHLFLKDLMFVGFASIAFLQTKYKHLQLKAFLFMCVFWRVIVAIFNVIGFYEPWVIYTLYFIYLYWLFRIFLIKEIPLNYTGKKPQKNAYSYNIFIPVHTFRGLLKALFVPFSDPRYETTILISGEWMYYVKNKLFFKIKKEDKVVERLINKTSAKVKVKPISPRRLRNINKLNFKPAFIGFRDCRRLQI